MSVELGPVQHRGWLLPSCPRCTGKVTYEDLRQSGGASCETCKLFARGIATICPLRARRPAVEWRWESQVLRGRDWQGHGNKEEYKIEFFIHPDSESLFVSRSGFPKFLVGHPVPEGTDVEKTVMQIQDWYLSCVKSHDSCRSTSATYVPTRLLDIQSPDCASGVRLLETKAGIWGSLDYICLSHCWAESRPDCITLKSTLEQNLKEIQWAAMPKTFQDAIGVLRRLAFRYLWIDSICIIQDDSDDWARESAAMCDVYSQAALTVAATNSPNSDHGLYSTLSPDFQSHEFSIVLTDGIRIPVWGRRPIPHFAAAESRTRPDFESPPLLQRGWVLQERLLSRRVVHFVRNEVAWECLHLSGCQCLGIDKGYQSSKVWLSALLHGTHAQHNTTQNPASQWFRLVEQYTRLALTFAKDRFSALSGAAQRSPQFRDGDKYVAGLWESEMLLGLTWYAYRPGHRPNEWIAPTWSWASVNGTVQWPLQFHRVVQGFLTLIKADCVLAGPDPTGQLSSASLTVRGPVASGILLWEIADAKPRKTSSIFSVQFSLRKMTKCFLPDYTLDRTTDEHLVPNGSKVWWLAARETIIGETDSHEYVGLILRESRRDPPAYERIGLLYIDNDAAEDHDFLMEHAIETELVIV
ncbi:heterokaryon incompatibility protein-domain-containing protein [Nemania abortiva]|nr:heterokaryon incompatibility protein-domain-containing protein [Nemania abortiva]